MIRSASILALSLLVLGGCAAAPAMRPPDTTIPAPAEWTSEVSSDRPRSDWWNGFGDPRLDRLVQRALERNHDLQAAAARLTRAEAEARIAGADLKPTLSVGLNSSRQKSRFPGAPIPTNTFTSVGVNFNASWEADLWGRLRAGARAALAESQATRADLRGARQSLAAQTARSWFAVVEARQQLRLALETVESFRTSADQVRSRYESGVRPALDLRLALSNLASAEALAALRRGQLDATTRQLEILLGRYPDRSFDAEMPGDELPATPPPIPAGLPADLIARRPDLAAFERRLAAADQRLVASRRALYPSLGLTAGGGTLTSEFRDLLDRDFDVWNLAANLLQPLFQGGRLRAGVDRSEAQLRELIAAYRSLALRAYAEVETALAAEGYLAQRELHLRESAEQLAAARSLAENRYRQGVGGFLTVLESQTRELTAGSELLKVRRERLSNRVDLHLALGGGFEPSSTEFVSENRP